MEMLKQLYTDAKLLLSSRTVLTLLILLATNAIEAYANVLSTEQLVLANLVLTTLAGHFRINTKAAFK